MEIGERVLLVEGGVSVFIVKEIDEDTGRAVVKSEVDGPGSYEFSTDLAALVRAE